MFLLPDQARAARGDAISSATPDVHRTRPARVGFPNLKALLIAVAAGSLLSGTALAASSANDAVVVAASNAMANQLLVFSLGGTLLSTT